MALPMFVNSTPATKLTIANNIVAGRSRCAHRAGNWTIEPRFAGLSVSGT